MSTQHTATPTPSALVFLAAAAAAAAGACGGAKADPNGVSPQAMTDALHAVIAADRAVYAEEVVGRLQDHDKVITATERFKDEKTLPLPAQMLRMGAEKARKTNPGFSYALLSTWPINKQNGPKTEVEKAGLKTVAESGKSYYGEERVGDTKYFTAVYPDKAVAAACANCHNGHEDSPRKDFKQGDVMGAVVIRVPLGK